MKELITDWRDESPFYNMAMATIAHWLDRPSLIYTLNKNHMQEKHMNELTTTATLEGAVKKDTQALAKKIEQDLPDPPKGFHTPSAEELDKMIDYAKQLRKEDRHMSKRLMRKRIAAKFNVHIVNSWKDILHGGSK